MDKPESTPRDMMKRRRSGRPKRTTMTPAATWPCGPVILHVSDIGIIIYLVIIAQYLVYLIVPSNFFYGTRSTDIIPPMSSLFFGYNRNTPDRPLTCNTATGKSKKKKKKEIQALRNSVVIQLPFPPLDPRSATITTYQTILLLLLRGSRQQVSSTYYPSYPMIHLPPSLSNSFQSFLSHSFPKFLSDCLLFELTPSLVFSSFRPPTRRCSPRLSIPPLIKERLRHQACDCDYPSQALAT